LRYANSVKVREIQPRLRKCLTDNRDDLTKVFARSEFGDNSTIFAVNIDLGGNDTRQNLSAIGNDGSSGFIARRFDAKNTNAHLLMLAQSDFQAGCLERTLTRESD
jgi:hypothetical protein